MGLTKVTYVDGVTVIEAQNLNEIQDAIIANENATDYALAAFPTDTISGSIASFPDGADAIPIKAMTVDIEPSQDLHGQSAPYPAGATPNKFDEVTELGSIIISTGENASSTTQLRSADYSPITPSTGYYAVMPSAIQSTGVYVFYYDSNKAFVSVALRNTANGMSGTTPATAAFFRLMLPADYGTTYNNNISINVPDSDHDYHKYSNLCPISGWTGADISKIGFNWWDEETLEGYYNSNGTYNYVAGQLCTKNPIPVLPSTAYCLKVPTTASSDKLRIIEYDVNGSYLRSALTNAYSSSDGYVVYTVGADCYYIKTSFHGNYGGTYRHNICINISSADNGTYQPYNSDSTTYTVSWQDEAGTVYKGYLTYNGDGTWTPTATHAMLNLADASWVMNLAGLFYADYTSGTFVGDVSGTTPDMLCSCYSIGARGSLGELSDNSISLSGVAGFQTMRLILRDDARSDATALIASLNGQTLLYELPTEVVGTPITTAELITTLLGDNNVWADCGDVSVTYRADTALYIDKKLGA